MSRPKGSKNKKSYPKSGREKLSKLLKGRYLGEEHPRWKPRLKPELCLCGCGNFAKPEKKFIHGHNKSMKGRKDTDKTRILKSQAHENQFVSEDKKIKIGKSLKGHFVSDETRDKIRVKLIGQGKKPETIIKLREKSKEKWENLDYQELQKKGRNIKPNRIEIKLMDFLEDFQSGEWKYVGNFEFWIGGKNPDFMNTNGNKKLIELYGNYWHKGENPQERIDHFKQYGFDTLVIWEKELKDLNKVKEKLVEFSRR